MDATDIKSAPVWDDRLLAHPHEVADKRRRVQTMFAAIAPSYDLNNRLHSLWMDQRWREKAVSLAELKGSDRVVDVACGTGDLSAKFAARLQLIWSDPLVERVDLVPGQVTGVDFTLEMLAIAKGKNDRRIPEFPRMSVANEQDETVQTYAGRRLIEFVNGDALALPLPDASADVVSIAFGIRNVADPTAAIREFYRVLRPGGRLIILEFSLPTNRLLRGLYNFYFRKILPRTATWISRDRTGAYKYLPESVNTFITRERMGEMMTAAGFARVEQFPMTFGVCVCYRGVKV